MVRTSGTFSRSPTCSIPQRRLYAVTPRAPLSLPGWPGYHWYVVPRVGYPDTETFRAAYAQLAAFHDELWERTGIPPERTVLGGFSMGSVMSYALGLGESRPAPAGILAFSGFVPVVDGWEPDLARAGRTRAFIAHGRNDPIMEIGFARRARDLLEQSGFDVEYHESDAAHEIDPSHVCPLRPTGSGPCSLSSRWRVVARAGPGSKDEQEPRAVAASDRATFGGLELEQRAGVGRHRSSAGLDLHGSRR